MGILSDNPSPDSVSQTSPRSTSLETFLREAFFGNLDTSGDCWEWPHAVNNEGYGRPRILGKNVLAHRLSWMLQHGDIPDGLLVLHKCDNRRCVRPDHLFLGTNLDNSRDKASKGRGTHRLTESDVRAMRRQYRDGGVSTPQLAEEFGVGVTTVAHIIHRRTWSWLNDEEGVAS